jgi:TadE-like protein
MDSTPSPDDNPAARFDEEDVLPLDPVAGFVCALRARYRRAVPLRVGAPLAALMGARTRGASTAATIDPPTDCRGDQPGSTRPMYPRSRGERGAALVELLLVLPLLAMLIFGGLSAANAYSHKLDVTHAAREGARYGATVPELQCSPVSNCGGKTWAQLVRSVAVGRSNGALTDTGVCVALVSGSTGTPIGSGFTTRTDGAACFDDGNGDPGKRVQVRATRTGDKLSAVLFSIPVTQSSTATARFEE